MQKSINVCQYSSDTFTDFWSQSIVNQCVKESFYCPRRGRVRAIETDQKAGQLSLTGPG
jgi:hypothetical protein